MDVAQRIEVTFGTRLHWFEVHRFADEPSFNAALHRAGMHDFAKQIFAFTRCYGEGDECGRMYLLDKSIGTLAREASNMAFGIATRHGITTLDEQFEHNHSALTAEITSKLYSQQKYY